MPNYGRSDLTFDKGEGPYLFAPDGRRYLDFAAGIAVNCLGHCHPHLVKALQDQAARLWHVSNLYHIPGQERLARRLVAASFADSVFFCNSGAEAVEAGIKTLRRYHYVNGAPERHRIIVTSEAFHGRTLATVTAGGQKKHTEGFAPLLEGFDRVAFGNLNELRDAIGPDTAGILVEPIQGEGGIRPAPAAYLRGLRQAADEFGLLLMFDEVQTGIGRTGKLFAHEWAGVTPDVLASAKGLGGGFPVGALLATEAAARVLTPGSHGSTFGGNPLAMAAANAVLDVVLAPGFLDTVIARSQALRSALETLVADYPQVFAGVRGDGLMIGLQCVVPNTEVIAELRRRGLLTAGAGENVLRLLPPLNIEPAHIDEALVALRGAAAALSAEGGGA